MGITTLGGIKISRTYPKISVKLVNNLDDLTDSLLYMSRVGEGVEYATYPPTLIGNDYLEFTFDDLTFDKKPGRFKARLVAEERQILEFYIHYVDNVVITVANAG